MSGHKLDLRKATIARLAQLYPACFYVARQERRPLKIGIRRDLAALDLGMDRRELDSALAWYVNGIGYLQSLRVGATRVGLDGASAGAVSEADEAHVREKLAAQSARRVSLLVEQLGSLRIHRLRADWIRPDRDDRHHRNARYRLHRGNC